MCVWESLAFQHRPQSQIGLLSQSIACKIVLLNVVVGAVAVYCVQNFYVARKYFGGDWIKRKHNRQ